MAEIVTLIAEILLIPVQFVGELVANVLAVIFRIAFAKARSEASGDPTSGEDHPASRWQVLGYSLVGTAVLSLAVGLICFFVWDSFVAAQWGMGISGFLGLLGAVKAAVI